MSNKEFNNPVTLAIAPSARGFGFAVIEEPGIFLDWGTKKAVGDKNRWCLGRIAEMVGRYAPTAVVLPDAMAANSGRSARIRDLVGQAAALAQSRRARVALISRKAAGLALLGSGDATKHEVASFLATRFPDILADRLPPKRRPWASEDHRMDIFEAVALGLAFRLARRPYSKRQSAS